MRAVSEVKAVLCTSAAVLALVWFGQAAMAQDAPPEEPDMITVEDGGEGMDGFIGPAEGGETVIDFEESDCGGCEAWTTFVSDGEGEEVIDGEEFVIEDESVLVDGEVVVFADDGGFVDEGEIKTEDDTGLVDAGGEEVDGEFVTTCDGCELQNMAGGEVPVFASGSPETQRDSVSEAPVVLGGSNGSETAVSRSSGNACESGPLSTMWICTVQGDSWRN